MTRIAGREDIIDLVRMGVQCARESHWNVEPVARDIARTFLDTMEGPGFVLMDDHGFISVVLVPVYFNRSVLQAMELNWYSENGRSGIGLLKAAADEAKRRGAVVFSIGTQRRTEEIEHVYRRLGFQPFGATFQREL